MIDTNINLTASVKARIVIDVTGPWLHLSDAKDSLAIFLPRNLDPAKALTIADAINDALESARAPKTEAAE